jgi:putative thiamine transport system permease protein
MRAEQFYLLTPFVWLWRLFLLSFLICGLGVLLWRAVMGLLPFEVLFSNPLLPRSLILTLTTGMLATWLALYLARNIACHWPLRLKDGERLVGANGFWLVVLAVLLAIPHAAFATGFSFLLSPAGYLARLFSPWATGWVTPPALWANGDPYGIALTLGLALKETPFLLLAINSQLAHLPLAPYAKVAASLGYAPSQNFYKILWPQLSANIRLPLFCVLVYGVSVVDMAMVLGPSAPPNLALLALDWLTHPDPLRQLQGQGAALILFGLCLLAIALWYGISFCWWFFYYRHYCCNGIRQNRFVWLQKARLVFNCVILLGVSAWVLLSLCLWSLTWRWPFPRLWPTAWSLEHWRLTRDVLWQSVLTSLGLGIICTFLSLFTSFILLEEQRQRSTSYRSPGRVFPPPLPSSGALKFWILSGFKGPKNTGRSLRPLLESWRALLRPLSRQLPQYPIFDDSLLVMGLIVPQLTLLYGVQQFWLEIDFYHPLPTVIAAQLPFTTAYGYFALKGPYLTLNPRYAHIAASLGLSPLSYALRLHWRLILPPLANAAAISFAVSQALYLPVRLMGGGRLETVTSQTLALATSGDRRQSGVMALIQLLLPAGGFLLAALCLKLERKPSLMRPWHCVATTPPQKNSAQ